MADPLNRNPFTRAKTAVFRYLKYRPRSEQEIRRKLAEKDLSAAVIDRAVSYFRDLGLIDDQKFAIGWARSRLIKPFGVSRIKQELRQKGISDDICTRALTEVLRDYEEYETVTALAAQRVRQYQKLDTRTGRRRLYGYLARRGFSIRNVIRAVNFIYTNEQNDE
ncbi:MAG: regulatory protein RecX [Candidatus Omnitrophota bacterium]